MRLSVITTDPGYASGKITMNAIIFVDGVKTKDCYTADEEAGIAYCNDRNKNGDLIIDGNSFKTKELHGKVKIKIKGIYNNLSQRILFYAKSLMKK